MMDDKTKMPFGKYKDKPLEQVPGSYLLWLGDQPEFRQKKAGLAEYIEKNRALLEKEAEGR